MKLLKSLPLVFFLALYFACSGGGETAQHAGKSPPGELIRKPPREFSPDELVTLVLDVRYANGELVRDTNLVVMIDRRPRDYLKIGSDGKVTIGNLQRGLCQVIVRDKKTNENLKLQECSLDSPVNNVLVRVPNPVKVDLDTLRVRKDSTGIAPPPPVVE